MAKTKHELETVIDAIRGHGTWANPGKFTSSGGVIVTVAQRLQVTRQTVYSYLTRWATARHVLDEERENMLDIAEGKLYSEVNKGNMTGIIFLLKTRGKSRGYVERQEITGADGKAIVLESSVGFDTDKL